MVTAPTRHPSHSNRAKAIGQYWHKGIKGYYWLCDGRGLGLFLRRLLAVAMYTVTTARNSGGNIF